MIVRLFSIIQNELSAFRGNVSTMSDFWHFIGAVVGSSFIMRGIDQALDHHGHTLNGLMLILWVWLSAVVYSMRRWTPEVKWSARLLGVSSVGVLLAAVLVWIMAEAITWPNTVVVCILLICLAAFYAIRAGVHISTWFQPRGHIEHHILQSITVSLVLSCICFYIQIYGHEIGVSGFLFIALLYWSSRDYFRHNKQA